MTTAPTHDLDRHISPLDEGDAVTADPAQTFRSHSFAASPAFGRASGAPGGIDEIDLHWVQDFAMTQRTGEQFIAKWLCAPIQAAVAVDADGRPLTPVAATEKDLDRLSRQSDGYIEAFGGAGVVELTTQRIVGTIGEGKSVFGPIHGSSNDVIAFAIELDQIATVDLIRKKGFFGVRDRGIMVTTRADGHIMMHAMRVAGGNVGRSNGDFARAVVTAAVATLRPSATAGLREALDRAEAGDWDADGDDLSAVLIERS